MTFSIKICKNVHSKGLNKIGQQVKNPSNIQATALAIHLWCDKPLKSHKANPKSQTAR